MGIRTISASWLRTPWKKSATTVGVAMLGSGQCATSRLLPSEVADLGAAFTNALAEATAMAERWDSVTGCYREVTE